MQYVRFVLQIAGALFIVMWLAANFGVGNFAFYYGPHPVSSSVICK